MVNRRIISVGVLLLLVGTMIPTFMTPVAATDHTVIFVCPEGQPPCHAKKLQDAINMSADGQIIVVHPGTYVGAVDIRGLDGQTNITIRSSGGPEVTIIDPDGAFIGVRVQGNMGDVTFEGFTVTENWVAGGIGQGTSARVGTSFHVSNNIVMAPATTTAHGNGIQVTGDGSTVTGNEVRVPHQVSPDWSGSGILVYGANNVLVSGNNVTSSPDDYCIAVGGGLFGLPVADAVTVRDNDVHGCGVGVLLQAGVNNATVVGNEIFDNGVGLISQGLSGSFGAGQPAGSGVSGNTFTNNTVQVRDLYDTAPDLNMQAVLDANTYDFSVVSRLAGDISPAAIFSTIQDAVDESAAGHTIEARSSGGAFVEDVGIPAGLDDLGLSGAVTIEGGIRTAAINTTLRGLEIVGGGSWGDAGNDAPAVWLEGGTGGHALDGLSLVGLNNSVARGLLFGIGVTATTVTDVTTTGWLSGVYINPSSDLTFEGLVASDNFGGIGSDGISAVTILDSSFTDNTEGIGASSVGLGVVVEGSIFDGNSDYGIANYGGESIMATGNYWGAITGPEDIFVDVSISIGGTGINPDRTLDIITGAGDRVLGEVDYTPWCLESSCTVLGLNIQ